MRTIGNVIYFIPPYCITDEQIDTAFRVIGEFLGRQME
jgi:adenosylmethionine-8-amino-7-oxononanoate aminotransferase